MRSTPPKEFAMNRITRPLLGALVCAMTLASAAQAAERDLDCRLIFEPGRLLVGNAGILVTRALFVKQGEAKTFIVVDAAMNDLLRPALYDAWHAVDPVRPRSGDAVAMDIVGPVCESADFLALDRTLALAEGDLLAVRAAGAYAMAMSSNYNSRPRACEVLVDGDAAHAIRRRETLADLFAHEVRLPPRDTRG